MEFIGFNYEKLNIFQSDLKTMEFENIFIRKTRKSRKIISLIKG